MASEVITLAQWLAGEFDNQRQAIDNPAWFVHLRWWHRPLPFRVNGCVALFAEQANALYLDRPYRQRVLVLQEGNTPDQLKVQYFGLVNPERALGGGANPTILKGLTAEDLELLPGCTLTVTRKGDCYRGEPDPNAQCCFQYGGQTRHVILGFEVTEQQFLSFDRGVEPESGRSLWGAVMGPYEFSKCGDFSAELV